MIHTVSTNTGPASISRWAIGSFVATIVLIYTTFCNVIEVSIVSNYVGGTIFDIAGYIGGLATQYAPWLPKMMAESAGTSTARLLRVGSVVLVILEVVAITMLLFLALHLILTLKRKTKPARVFGVLGFALGLVIPILMFAVVKVITWQMTNEMVSLKVLSVPLGPRIQIVAAFFGCVCAVLTTEKSVRVKQGK
jgi:hypothetical protein